MKPPEKGATIEDILENEVPDRYTLTEKTWATLERHKQHHLEQGNGFGYGLITQPFAGKSTRTMSARYHKDGAEILLDQSHLSRRPRRLTPYEASGLMGFPENYRGFFSRAEELKQPVSDTQAYHQFGNSVAVPLVTDIAKLLVRKLIEAGAMNTEDD